MCRNFFLAVLCVTSLLAAENIKTRNGIPIANIKTINGVAIANIKTINGVDNTGIGGPSGTQVASDNFDSYANFSALTDQANWNAVAGGTDTHLNLKPAADGRVSGGSGGRVADYHTDTYSADQYSTGTLEMPAGTENATVGVAVRISATVDDYYTVQYKRNSTTLYLRKVNSGTMAQIQSTSKTYADGVKLWLQAVGTGSATRLSVWEDTGSGWVAVWMNEDPGGTYIDGGKPGVAAVSNDLDAKLDDWSGGDVP